MYVYVMSLYYIWWQEITFFFWRKTCFLKNAGHKSLRLIAKWQLDNIYVEPLVCEEPGPGSSQTGCWYLGCFKQTRGLRKAVLGNKQLFEKNQALVLRKQGVQHRCYPAAILRSIWATCGQHFWENKFFAKNKGWFPVIIYNIATSHIHTLCIYFNMTYKHGTSFEKDLTQIFRIPRSWFPKIFANTFFGKQDFRKTESWTCCFFANRSWKINYSESEIQIPHFAKKWCFPHLSIYAHM